MPVWGQIPGCKAGHVVGFSLFKHNLKCMSLGDTETRWGGGWGSGKPLRFIRHAGHTQASWEPVAPRTAVSKLSQVSANPGQGFSNFWCSRQQGKTSDSGPTPGDLRGRTQQPGFKHAGAPGGYLPIGSWPNSGKQRHTGTLRTWRG